MKRFLLISFLLTISYCMAQSPTNGLVAYYGFENNSNSHNGLYNLSNLHASGTAINYTNSGNGTGNAAYFNNTALKSTAISSQITNTFTICFWQKNDTPQNQIYATRFELFGSVFYRNPNASGQWSRSQISISNGSWVGPQMDTTLSNNTWQHIAITYASNGSFTRWVNGVYDSTLDSNVGFANLIKYNQILSIGGGADGTGNFMNSKAFNGYIDEFYIYNRALTSAEINQVKNDVDGVPTESAVVSTDALFQNTNAQITTVLNANNIPMTVNLNWGDTTALTNTVALGSISGTSNQTFITDLNGLIPTTNYLYQLVFTYGSTTTYSPIYSFSQSVVDAFRFNNSFISQNGTLYLGPGPSGLYPGFVADRSGNPNSAVFLKNYEALVSGNIPTLPVGGNKRSVSFWFKRARTTPVEYHSIFEWGTQTTANAYGVTIYENNTVSNYGWQADVTSQTATALTTNWDHYVVTYSDNKTVCIYKNGMLISTGSQPNWNTIGNIITIGSKNGGLPTNIYGHLDDFEIYNTTLSPTQVNNLFLNGTALLSNPSLNAQSLTVRMYPNPTTDSFTIEMDAAIKTVNLYNLHGQKVFSSKSKKVDISSLSKGIYLVQIEDENNNAYSQKLIIK